MSMFAESLRAFLKPIVPLLDDQNVSEILINGPREVWIEKAGRLSRTDCAFTEEGLLAAARNMAQFVGRPLTEAAVFTNDVVEPEVIDGAVTGVAVAVRRSGEGLRKVQSGFVRHYALATVLGVAVMIVYLVARVA